MHLHIQSRVLNLDVSSMNTYGNEYKITEYRIKNNPIDY